MNRRIPLVSDLRRTASPVAVRRFARAACLLVLLGQSAADSPAAPPPCRDALRLTDPLNPATLVEAELPAGAGDGRAYELEVRVGRGASVSMLGSTMADQGRLRFRPKYPFRRGTPYVARLSHEGRELARLEFEIPLENDAPRRVVEVYPTSSVLPENQLKFYIHFSGPMKRGEAYARIRLEREDGTLVADPFLELGQELWDREGKRFTLLIDPGRIKRGLKPREEAGPVLEAGQAYRLVIDQGWKDSRGLELAATYAKSFRAGPADERQPNPEQWELQTPAAGSREPLRIALGESLDHALLERLLTVADSTGQALAGEIQIDQQETRWTFTPAAAWTEGVHLLNIGAELEDLAGNSIAKPFEVDVLGPVKPRLEPESRRLEFLVR